MLRKIALALGLLSGCMPSDRSSVSQPSSTHQEIGLVGLEYVLNFELPDASWKLSDAPAPPPALGTVYVSGIRKLTVTALIGKDFPSAKQFAYDVSAALEAQAGMTDEHAAVDDFDQRLRIELPEPRTSIITYRLRDWPNVRALIVYSYASGDVGTAPFDEFIRRLRLVRR